MRTLALAIIILTVGAISSNDEQLNVFGKRLESCSTSPMTGYYRTGSCEWHGSGDYGVHTVCAQMTREFLEFTRSRGNDLSTRQGQFPGLREGDRWCLCASRWKEALTAKKAPLVILRSTHRITLNQVTLNELRANAFRKNNRSSTSNKT